MGTPPAAIVTVGNVAARGRCKLSLASLGCFPIVGANAVGTERATVALRLDVRLAAGLAAVSARLILWLRLPPRDKLVRATD